MLSGDNKTRPAPAPRATDQSMPTPLPRLCLALATLVGLTALGLGSCGPEPVGVDDCRRIESARCHAANHCGIVTDADSCERFYRDHCLHGLAVSESPGAQFVDACVQAIEAAGQCASDDADTSLDECNSDAITPLPRAELDTACDVVQNPELIRECEFLIPEEPDPGEGGAAGASN